MNSSPSGATKKCPVLYRVGYRILNATARMFPKSSHIWDSFRCRLTSREHYKALQEKMVEKLYDGNGITVLSGPFRGMRYFNGTLFGPAVSRWLGAYEEQNHGAIEEAIARNPSRLIDVGSAEGYYAVGMARRLPDMPVYSYDTDIFSRHQQQRLARMNSVKNLTLGGFCSHEILSKVAVGGTLIIVDIESAELGFLDPSKCDVFRFCDILVEVHSTPDYSFSELTDLIADRFIQTHNITRIRQTTRDLEKYRILTKGRLTTDELQEVLNEHRDTSEQTWLWMTSISPA